VTDATLALLVWILSAVAFIGGVYIGKNLK
jgi:hypothetical protein